jgi:hypothetical protein
MNHLLLRFNVGRGIIFLLLARIISRGCLFITDDTLQMIRLEPELRFNGGGHINHTIFWKVCIFEPE